MSAEVVTKRKGRPKKVVDAGSVPVIEDDLQVKSTKKPSRKATTSIPEAIPEVLPLKKSMTKRSSSLKKEVENPKSPAKTTTSKLSAKNSNNEEARASTSPSSELASKILPQATAFSEKSESIPKRSPTVPTKRKVSTPIEETAKVASDKQKTLSPEINVTQPATRQGALEQSSAPQDASQSSTTASSGSSKFLTSFLNDPEPAPTGGEIIQEKPQPAPSNTSPDGQRKQTVEEALQKHHQQQHRKPIQPTSDPRLNTLPPMKPFTASSFKTLKSSPPPASKMSSSAASASTSTTKPLPSHRVHLASKPKPSAASSSVAGFAASSAPPPIRPTQLPLSELKKNPEFKRRSRNWVMLIAGLPVLIGTSWELWQRDHERRNGERFVFKGWGDVFGWNLQQQEQQGSRGIVVGDRMSEGRVSGEEGLALVSGEGNVNAAGAEGGQGGER